MFKDRALWDTLLRTVWHCPPDKIPADADEKRDLFIERVRIYQSDLRASV